jgi:mono/diheme cytochrome c family protein
MNTNSFLAALVGFLLGLACLVPIVFLGGWLNRVPATANVQPPQSEPVPAGGNSEPARREQLAEQSSQFKNPLPASHETLAAGMNIYRNNCAGCHGVPSQPSRWGMRGFSPPVPQFGDRPSKLTDSEMFVVIKHGLKNSGMAGWEVLLPDQDIWRVATFLSRLSDLPQPLDANWKTKRPT